MAQTTKNISIGVCAYNEGRNIGVLLERLLSQKLSDGFRIKEIIVVASGCTDNTKETVRSFELKDARVGLLTQEKREGKASAINLFLKTASGDILVLESADTLPEEDAIQNLVAPFSDPKVGLVSGRPIPLNRRDDFIGFTVNLIWDLHHKLSLKSPKATEVIAFLPVIRDISRDTAVDDLAMEYAVKKTGYGLRYSPEAVVYNRGPAHVSDLIRQRRRIHAGYMHTRKIDGYAPMTVDTLETLKVLYDVFEFSPKKMLFLVGAVFLEFYVRCLARIDFYIFGDNPYNWDVAESTKKVL